jgi:zinc finger HIT domain-containing protein 1
VLLKLPSIIVITKSISAETLEMEEDGSNSNRRMSSRTRKVATKMVAALASSDNRTQAALARLDALENDNAGFEAADPNIDDDEASLDDDDQG